MGWRLVIKLTGARGWGFHEIHRGWGGGHVAVVGWVMQGWSG